MKTKKNYRLISLALCLFFASYAMAQTQEEAEKPEQGEILEGVPFVEEDSTILLGGKKIVLWGIDMLAPDQQCWQSDASWGCGEWARESLRHFIEGRWIRCNVLEKREDETCVARCFRQKRKRNGDIAKHMLRHGWAMACQKTEDKTYLDAQETARDDERGIWSSRFQTAQDWKDGIQRFVGEEDKKESSPRSPTED